MPLYIARQRWSSREFHISHVAPPAARPRFKRCGALPRKAPEAIGFDPTAHFVASVAVITIEFSKLIKHVRSEVPKIIEVFKVLGMSLVILRLVAFIR